MDFIKSERRNVSIKKYRTKIMNFLKVRDKMSIKNKRTKITYLKK